MRFSRIIMVMLVIILVILGLNVSNRGISTLTMEKRGAVLALGFDKDNIGLQVLGKNYQYPRDRLTQLNNQLKRQVYQLYYQVKRYPGHFKGVFDAVIVSKV